MMGPHRSIVGAMACPCPGTVLAFKLTLMLQKIHARPITEVETVGIQGHPMHPGWNNRGQHLMIERKPANVLNSYLFRLVIQRDPRITCRLIGLHNHFIKPGIAQLATATVRRRDPIPLPATTWLRSMS